MYIKKTILLVLIISITNCFSQTSIESIQNAIKQYTKSVDFNGRIIVFEGDSIKLDFIKGFSNFEKNKLIGKNTTFKISSVSKMITSLAILSLIDDGKLKLEDEINTYYPKLRKGITVRNLLNHTSGLQNTDRTIFHNWELLDGSITSKQFIELLAKEPERFSPNDKYMYNNTNYVLLYDLFEKIQKQTVEEFMIENGYFRSLTVDRANKSINYDFNVLNGQWIHDETKSGNYLSIFDESLKGSGHYFINPKESIDIVIAYKKLISKQLFNQAILPNKLNDGSESNYGYGIKLEYDDKKNIILNHLGKSYGGRAYFSHYPQKDVTLFMVTNIDDPNFHILAHELNNVIANNSTFKMPELSMDFELSKKIHLLSANQINDEFQRLKKTNRFYLDRLKINDIAFDFWELKEFEKGLAVLKINAYEFSDNTNARFYYADGLQETGHYAEAVREYKILRKLYIDSGDLDVKDIDSRIKFCLSKQNK